MRTLISALLLSLAGALSCGMMEDFYEYSGAEFKTSVYVQQGMNLFVSHNGGQSFSSFPINGSLADWYVNPSREIMTVEDDTFGTYNIYMTHPDGRKNVIFSFPSAQISWKALTAASNGDFYYCYYNVGSGNRELFRLPSGDSTIQPISIMTGFAGETAMDWRIWAIRYNGNNRLFACDINTAQLYMSLDGGMNFISISPPPTGIVSDMIIQGSVIFMSTGSASDGIYRSTDGGNIFTSVALPFGCNSLAVSNSGRIFTSASSFIYYSDNGMSWPLGVDVMGIVNDIATDHVGRLYILTTAAPGLVISDDGGSTYTTLNPVMSGERMQVVEYHD